MKAAIIHRDGTVSYKEVELEEINQEESEIYSPTELERLRADVDYLLMMTEG